MQKKAVRKQIMQSALPHILRAIPGALAGGAAGGYAGYNITPRLGGYQDVEPARRISAVIDALLGAAAGGAATSGLLPSWWRSIPKARKPGVLLKTLLSAPTAVGVGEMVPIGISTMSRTREAMKEMSEAGKGLAESSKVTSIPYNIQRLLGTPAARGAGVGAGAAGLGALLSGLTRRQTEPEFHKRTTRSSMIGKDFLKYLLPSLVAGGVVGSLKDKVDLSKLFPTRT